VDKLDPSYRVLRPATPIYWLAVPVAVLVIVVTIVSVLVFTGIIQGHEARVGPEQVPTTQPTVQIAP
jgi:hypothetical protein